MTASSPRQAQRPELQGTTPAIEVDHVSRWFGNVMAVNNMSFTVGPGVTGLLGPNGAGKSTLLHLLSGFLRPSAGAIQVMGRPAWRNPSMYREVGLVPEREATYPFLTGLEFVRLSAALHGLPDADAAAVRAIRTVEMTAFQHRPTGGYSKGMKQRIKVAAAIVHEPRLLILDEPFNGMDPRQRLQMMDLLKAMGSEGKAILFSSHILEEVERLAETVLVIVAGRLAASGDFREIRRLMTDRPHTFRIRSSDNRLLGSSLAADESVTGVDISPEVLTVRAADFAAFTSLVSRVARDVAVTLFEFAPSDESLESVFSYLVQR